VSPEDREALRRLVWETGKADVGPRGRRLGIAFRGSGRYAVLNGGCRSSEALTRDGEWEAEPELDDRDRDFLARARWDLDEALDQVGQLLGEGGAR
jgi:hypothetical protein